MALNSLQPSAPRAGVYSTRWQCLCWLLESSRVDLTWRKLKWNRILPVNLLLCLSKCYEPGPAHSATHACLFVFNACSNRLSAWHKFPLFAKIKMLLLPAIKLFSPFIHRHSSWSAPLIFKDAIKDFVCKQCVNMYFCCSDVVCLSNLGPLWICCPCTCGLSKSFSGITGSNKFHTLSSIWMNNFFIISSSLQMELRKNQALVNFAATSRKLKIFKENPYNFQRGTILVFQPLHQTLPSV